MYKVNGIKHNVIAGCSSLSPTAFSSSPPPPPSPSPPPHPPPPPLPLLLHLLIFPLLLLLLLILLLLQYNLTRVLVLLQHIIPGFPIFHNLAPISQFYLL